MLWPIGFTEQMTEETCCDRGEQAQAKQRKAKSPVKKTTTKSIHFNRLFRQKKSPKKNTQLWQQTEVQLGVKSREKKSLLLRDS